MPIMRSQRDLASTLIPDIHFGIMDALLPNLFTLLMLIMLQAVLGFDNLLYISLESKRAPLENSGWLESGGSVSR